jgi:hypothetical protein
MQYCIAIECINEPIGLFFTSCADCRTTATFAYGARLAPFLDGYLKFQYPTATPQFAGPAVQITPGSSLPPPAVILVLLKYI